MKDVLILAALCLSPFAAGGAVYAYDSTETHHTYHADIEFLSGQPGIWEHTSGALGLRQGSKLVGYYGGGKPRVIGFGCEGADMPIIAMEEDYLPRCKRVEGITYS